MKIVEQSAELLAMTPNPVTLIERCGRVCYKSEEKMECGCAEYQKNPFNYPPGRVPFAMEDMEFDSEANELKASIQIAGAGRTLPCSECLVRATKFVRGIIKRGHESVLEHASATFLLVTDRGMTHELVRHRVASYSQESTRFCDYGNKGGEITVVRPDVFGYGSEPYEAWAASVHEAERAYLAMTKKYGTEPQWARSVLPTCLKTEIVVTANFRQWRHMMGLRLGNKAGKAHPQIRALFRMILERFLETEAAFIFGEFIDE